MFYCVWYLLCVLYSITCSTRMLSIVEIHSALIVIHPILRRLYIFQDIFHNEIRGYIWCKLACSIYTISHLSFFFTLLRSHFHCWWCVALVWIECTSAIVLSINLWWILANTKRRIRIKKQIKTKRNQQKKWSRWEILKTYSEASQACERFKNIRILSNIL